jgi:hypothetical protein
MHCTQILVPYKGHNWWALMKRIIRPVYFDHISCPWTNRTDTWYLDALVIIALHDEYCGLRSTNAMS